MSAVAPNPATDAPTTDARVEELVESFSFLDDWDDRFRYPIDLGRRLAPMEPALKTEETKVRGCTSQVWIVERVAPGVEPGAPPTLHFIADSDAHIVKGLIAALLAIYDGRTPQDRKSTRLNSSHLCASRMPAAACKKK